jgi:hypothetical protein
LKIVAKQSHGNHKRIGRGRERKAPINAEKDFLDEKCQVFAINKKRIRVFSVYPRPIFSKERQE